MIIQSRWALAESCQASASVFAWVLARVFAWILVWVLARVVLKSRRPLPKLAIFIGCFIVDIATIVDALCCWGFIAEVSCVHISADELHSRRSNPELPIALASAAIRSQLILAVSLSIAKAIERCGQQPARLPACHWVRHTAGNLNLTWSSFIFHNLNYETAM